ncbi:MAG TPA: tetratricopeptide repeat protein [Urbifossiella sp.]|nr:tetratricopeptide repeat protein [Urbifossiella sp.]
MPSSLKGRIALALIVATFLLYSRCLFNDFLDYDDRAYVTGNPAIQRGVDAESIQWAFTAVHASNWHPLTWLAHALDWQLFGGDAAGHHAVNVLLHCANVLLVFLVLSRMTGAIWRSAAVAALFAFHPLHVESVAWVAERKDVLSTFFGLLAMAAYAAYAERATAVRYLAVMAAFALSLLAKPMLVTLPFVFLLLDHWPLQRFERSIGWLLLEKAPLVLLSLASSIVTVFAQSDHALVPLHRLPFDARVANAIVAYGTYLRRTIWPDDLAIFYPHASGQVPWLQAVVAGAFLMAITIAAIRWRKRCPAVLVGWCWFLGTLVPVIGLVQVGNQALADRYTYFPLLGIFLAAVWMVPAPAAGNVETRTRLIAAASVILGICAISTLMHEGHWQNEETIWRAALSADEANAEAHFGIGTVLFNRGQMAEGVAHFERAVELDPAHALSLHNLGLARLREGRTAEAIELLRRACAIGPRVPIYRNSLGLALLRSGERGEARSEFEEALRLDPQAEYHFNLAMTLDDPNAATAEFQAGARLDPGWSSWALRLADKLLDLRESRFRCPEEALLLLQQVKAVTPEPSADILASLAFAYGETGRKSEAAETARQAVQQARREGNPELERRLQFLVDRYAQ